MPKKVCIFESMDFIEVKRVIIGKNKQQKVVSEAIQVKEIKTFRPWFKSKTDTFDGEATLIVLYNENKGTKHEDFESGEEKEVIDYIELVSGEMRKAMASGQFTIQEATDNAIEYVKSQNIQSKKVNLPTMMIAENFDSFVERMSGRVIILAK